jgi:hypothetical protein
MPHPTLRCKMRTNNITVLSDEKHIYLLLCYKMCVYAFTFDGTANKNAVSNERSLVKQLTPNIAEQHSKVRTTLQNTHAFRLVSSGLRGRTVL